MPCTGLLHGDVTAAVDAATGTVGDSTGYSPFGEVTAQSGAAGPLGYQGEYTDPDTGQVNMHARWYDPASGGFSSRDSWTLNPVPSVNANRYGYGGGDPLGNTDPSGHCFGLCVAIGIGVVLLATAVATSAGVGAKQSQGASWTDSGSWKQSWKNEKRGAGRIWCGIRDLFGSHKTHHRKSTTGGHFSLPNTSGLAAAIRAQAQARAAARANQGNSGGGGGGGGGGYGGGTVGFGSTGPCVWDCFVEQGPPPPPPPPPWRKLIKQALTTETARPTTDADVDEEHQRFVDDAFTRAQKDLGLTDKQLRRYFKYFPTLKDDAKFREEFKNHLAGWNDQPGNCMSGGNTSSVYYMSLDSANGNRATGVLACLGADAVDYRGRGRKADPDKETEIMGGDTARGRGTDRTNPAGWQHLDGDRGWARGHLLGRQLGGNGRDWRNLVKMYNAANSDVMAGYEETVRGRLDAGEKIFYASIPEYDGGNPVPKTVEMYALGSSGSFLHWTVYNTPDGLPPATGGTP
ncbi:RHS repeat-associated core domain-containing protein [Streptomyces sp. NPDC101225]|uniref:RHS repeat-associated core domain-containing protein n=1 Tax=Streptomyces sp. NPDC101225 TaxID=3366135 RepID=UPI0037FF3ECE